MAKLTKISYEFGGVRCEAQVSASKDGAFSIPFPPEVVQAKGVKAARADTLKECEAIFRRGIKEYEEATEKKEKILAIRVHSLMLGNDRKPNFGERVTLDVEAQIMLKTSLMVGGKVRTTYEEHPDVADMHKRNPIPWEFQMDDFDDFNNGKATEIPWTQEREDWLVGLLLSIKSICEILGSVTQSPDTLIENMAKGLLLGAPPKGEA